MIDYIEAIYQLKSEEVKPWRKNRKILAFAPKDDHIRRILYFTEEQKIVIIYNEQIEENFDE